MNTTHPTGLVVLDGPDASGKTTLAEKLLSFVPEERRTYIHLTYHKSPREMFLVQYQSLWKASIAISLGNLVVIDRHWLSDNIYAGVYRGGTKLNAESRMWDRVMRRMGAVQVLCAPDPDSAVERHQKMVESGREEMYLPDERIRQIAQKYRDLYFNETPLEPVCGESYSDQLTRLGRFLQREDTLLYDIDLADALEKASDRIFYRLAKQRSTQLFSALDHARPNFLGHLATANVLFLGERLNAKKPGRWPFVDFRASSGALSSILHELEFDETRGVWSNMFHDDDHLSEVLRQKPGIKVIAFGRPAHDAFQKKFKHHAHYVFHPSFAKRFNKTEQLTNQLQSIL